ncbi:pre-RNA processing PIH1/Nop17-domain-containing protein [Haematococcus lacustris]
MAGLFEGSFVSEFQALSQLIRTEEEHVDTSNVSKPTPASIGPKELLNVKVPAPKARKDPKAIWDLSEVGDLVEDDVDDGRAVPEYEFMYKQAVGSADVYLGMSGKDESSGSCEDLVMKISLPTVNTMAELDLEVKSNYIKLNATAYKLSVYLPHSVMEERGNAKWDATKKTLTVTLPIVREAR